MGASDLELVKGIVKCNASTYFEWKEQITALLAGLSFGPYLNIKIDFAYAEQSEVAAGN
jgi:hypothetical protein